MLFPPGCSASLLVVDAAGNTPLEVARAERREVIVRLIEVRTPTTSLVVFLPRLERDLLSLLNLTISKK